MKKITPFIVLLFVGSLIMSCQSDSSNTRNMMASSLAGSEHAENRSIKANKLVEAEAIHRFSLADVKVDLETMEMVALQKMNAEDADAQVVMDLNAAFMSAEKEAQLLDVNFSMSEEPVENGMFIFSIESPDAKKLTLEMFDEEGYAMTANNTFGINEGNNYKALNVKEMDNGDYIFRLKDDQGKELMRTVTIDQE